MNVFGSRIFAVSIIQRLKINNAKLQSIEHPTDIMETVFQLIHCCVSNSANIKK